MQQDWLAKKGAAAARHIGPTPTSRLAWLIAFAQRNNFSAKEAATISGEIHLFIVGQLGAMRRSDHIGAVGQGTSTLQSPPTLEPQALLGMADEVRTAIGRLKSGQFWEIKLAEWPEFTRRLLPVDRGERILSSYLGKHRECFLWAVADLLVAEGTRIQRCARGACGRLFVKKKRGLFCSLRCRRREHAHRYRETHSPEHLRELRHNRYIREFARKRKISVANAKKMIRERAAIRAEEQP